MFITWWRPILTSSSWLWTCWTIRSMATIFPPPLDEGKKFKHWIKALSFQDGWSCAHLEGRRCQPASWSVRCTAQRQASQTCCIAWWRLQCPGHVLWCPCGAGGPVWCLSLCPQRFSYPGAADREWAKHLWGIQALQLQLSTTTTAPHYFTENTSDRGEWQICCHTWRSSLSAKHIIPSNMITLAPYTFFCRKRKSLRKRRKQQFWENIIQFTFNEFYSKY